MDKSKKETCSETIGRDSVSLSKKGLISNSDYQLDQFERENKIPDCVFLEIIDKISDKMHNRAVRNAKIAYYSNMTLIEFAKKFHVELD